MSGPPHVSGAGGGDETIALAGGGAAAIASDDDSDFAALPLPAVLRVNERCDAFEAVWRAGQRPRAEDYLGDAAGAERETLRRHLSRIEADYAGLPLAEFCRRLDAEGLRPAGWAAPAGTSSADLADELVRTGVLTPYQAAALLDPHPHPLALDDYLILDRVAAGGMGTVYRAVHRRMKRDVALKVLADGRPGGAGDDGSRSRWFQREVEAAGRLSHPNVVTAYDAGEARGVAYLASEFVDGTDLRQWVAEHGPMPVADAVRAARDAAVGLAYAHEAGVVHRDVKPSNLIRTRAGVVRVLDVGLARLNHPAGLGGPGGEGEPAGVVGTPDFMAPEQATDPGAVDARADVYALGCTLYYLLTGRPVYDGGATAAERVAAHRAGEVPSLVDARPDAPAALDALFRRMLAREPQDRPAAMHEVIAALDALSARPRSPRAIVASGAVLLLGAAAAAVALYRPGRGAAPVAAPQATAAPSTARPPVREIPFDAAAYQAEWAAALNAPVEIEPVPGLKARLIPPGRFRMGTRAELIAEWVAAEPNETIRDRLRSEAERPAAVDAAFYMTTTEVTVAAFRQFVDAQDPPYRTLAERPGGVGYRLDPGGVWRVVPGPTWRDAGQQPATDDHPVCNVGRDDAADFCRWLTIRVGGRYECRLPIEAEWEYACRAGSAGLWAGTSEVADLGPLAWYAGTVDPTDARIRPVARKAANAFGLFDVHGNIAEWCTASPPATGAVLRGGHVRSPAWETRSAARDPAPPTSPQGGFRVVLVPQQTSPPQGGSRP